MMDGEDTHPPGARLAGLRLAIGFAQGVALFILTEVVKSPEGPAPLYGALFMVLLLIPVAALGAVGSMRPRTSAIWLAGAAVVTALLGAYEGATRAPGGEWPVFGLTLATAAALFIGHHLVLAADQARRWFAPYARYFDNGWRDGVRLALSGAFTAALWMLLGLGALLFGLIGLKLFSEVIRQAWFAMPVTATVFALAVHLTDVRAALVRGVRTLALTLLSYLLPVMTLIAAGFVIALVFTGLEPLWKTKSAAAILLSAAAALIILINSAYQDGARATTPPRVLKWSGRVAAWLIAPLTAIAAYGLWLRLAQHGLTPDRIRAGACIIVAAGYAVGYAYAAVARGGWLRALERANVLVAHLVVAVLIALFSPIADPRRLSVDDQMARLKAGRVTPEAFDYRFLRFDAGRYGERALADLADHPSGPKGAQVAELAKAAQKADSRYEVAPAKSTERPAVVRVAGGGSLPEDFLKQAWPGGRDPLWKCDGEAPVCAGALVDLNGDGAVEIVLAFRGNREAFRKVDGRWVKAGQFVGASCGDETGAIAEGRFTMETPLSAWKDLMVQGRRLRFVEEDEGCPTPGS
jgi:hypothetical protein